MDEINLKDLFSYFCSKFVWIIITVVIVVYAGNFCTNLLRIPKYQSSTTIVLVSETNNAKDSSYSDLQFNKNLVGTYSEIIKSRKILNEVINNLNLSYSVTELSKNISVSSVTNTEIIKVTVTDINASMATKIANEITKVFSTEIKKIYNLNNVFVLDEANDGSAPYNVNFVKDNIIYLFIALILSSGAIFVAFYFDTSIKGSKDIENKFGLTILGVVPETEGVE